MDEKPSWLRLVLDHSPNLWALRRYLSKIPTLLPDWCSKINEPRQKKLFFRCWLASWISLVLMLPPKNLAVMGNAAFFAAIVSILMPANMPIQSFLLAAITMVAACGIGIVWGCAAIGAAYAARDKGISQAHLESLIAANGGPLSYYDMQSRIYHGDFLDPRSTGVFAAFFALGTFAFGYARGSSPRFVIPTTVGTIFFDALCTSGPLMPTASYSILNTYIISTAYYLAIALVLILVVFPQTLNNEWIWETCTLLDAATELVGLQENVLDQGPNDIGSELLSQLRSDGDKIAKLFQGLKAMTPMLHTELSYSQLGPVDLESLQQPLGVLVTRCRGLMSFAMVVSSRPEVQNDKKTPPQSSGSSEDALSIRNRHSSHPLKSITSLALDTEVDLPAEASLEELVPTLRVATEGLRAAILRSLRVAKHTLCLINENRFKGVLFGPKRNPECPTAEETDVAAALHELAAAMETFQSSERLKLLAPRSLFMACEPTVDLPPLYACFVFQSNVLWTANAAKSVLLLLLDLQERRLKPRMWFPTRLSKLSDYFHLDGKRNEMEEDPIPQSEDEDAPDDYFAEGSKRDPDSLPPDTFMQRIGEALHRFSHWLTRRKTIYAFKFMIISVALWLPQVFKSTSWFYYSQKGLWGLIISQITSAVYVSDHLSVLRARLLGTASGGLMGMVAWYAGNGRGTGNPYGLGASAAVCLAPMVFFRLFGPIPLEGMVAGVTTVIIIGYSWVDTHGTGLVMLFGHGWHIVWRRTLLVLIGSTASLLMMYLPPQSLRRDIRRFNAANIKEISRLYSTLLSTWLMDIGEDETVSPASSGAEAVIDGVDFKPTGASYAGWAPTFRARLTKMVEFLPTLRAQTNAARREGSLRGRWPSENYDKLVEIQFTMLTNLTQLAASLRGLSPKWRRMLMHETPFLNPNLISDVMAVVAIVAMSLDTGEAIHEVLPRSLLDRVHYHHTMRPILQELRSGPISRVPSVVGGFVHQPASHHQTRYASPEFALYATGCSAAYQILVAVDKLHQVTRDLCGEIPLRGFAHWRREFELKQLGERV